MNGIRLRGKQDVETCKKQKREGNKLGLWKLELRQYFYQNEVKEVK
jgi:hypothetical protein